MLHLLTKSIIIQMRYKNFEFVSLLDEQILINSHGYHIPVFETTSGHTEFRTHIKTTVSI